MVRLRQAETRRAPDNLLHLTGRETGTIETYLARIEALARTGADRFAVTASEPDGLRFIQVGAGRGRKGTLSFRFDMPLADWSQGPARAIEEEARKRGLDPRRTTGDPVPSLQIEFASSGDHAVFARWVVTSAFGLPADARFEIVWG